MVRMHPVKPKGMMICRAFADGAPKGANCDVFYGVNEDNHDAWTKARVRGNWFYIDNAYFDSVRGQQYRITRNRVQCDPFGQASDGKRFAALGLELKPMNARASDVWVLVEQSPSFMQWVANDPTWLETAAGRIPRGHRMTLRRWDSDKIKQQETLPEVLDDAWTLVTHSSAAAVTAALLGVPAIVSPMSALYRMVWSTHAEHDQRQHYLNVLADNQWSIEDIREGKAWQHLNRS